jgi:hypothetical protein
MARACGRHGVSVSECQAGRSSRSRDNYEQPDGTDLDKILGHKQIRLSFFDRAVARTDAHRVAPDLAARPNASVGRGNTMLGTRAGYDALFDAVTPEAAARKGSR